MGRLKLLVFLFIVASCVAFIYQGLRHPGVEVDDAAALQKCEQQYDSGEAHPPAFWDDSLPCEENQTTPAQPPAPPPVAPPLPGTLSCPVPGAHVTQSFGPVDNDLEPSYMSYLHFHEGIDLGIGSNTPIHAAAAGKITYAELDPFTAANPGLHGTGYTVHVYNGSWVFVYFHMIGQPPVHVGDTVQAGQVIGYVGSTGASTGPHLHFGISTNGNSTFANGAWVDPAPLMQPC